MLVKVGIFFKAFFSSNFVPLCLIIGLNTVALFHSHGLRCMYAMKSWEFTHLKMELVSDISDAVSVPSIRGLGDECHALHSVYAHKYALGAQTLPTVPSVVCVDMIPITSTPDDGDRTRIFTWLLTWETFTVHSHYESFISCMYLSLEETTEYESYGNDNTLNKVVWVCRVWSLKCLYQRLILLLLYYRHINSVFLKCVTYFCKLHKLKCTMQKCSNRVQMWRGT